MLSAWILTVATLVIRSGMDRKPWSMKKDPEEALAGADMPPLLGWMPILEEIDFREWLREQLAVLEEKRSRAVAGPTWKKTSIERRESGVQRGVVPTAGEVKIQCFNGISSWKAFQVQLVTLPDCTAGVMQRRRAV
ncbi:UNVERIFIED_CONTAM: hypothetical protein FKN15_027566 [Acipenser sinensis]